MKVIPPVSVTSAMVLSSSVVEIPPAAYAGGTTYALDALVSTGTAGQVISVYKSLQPSNTGHTPSSSPTWWQLIGTTYSAYAAGTWALGDRVIDATTHKLFESKIASNAQPLTNATAWADVGYSNYWNPFDTLRNTQAISPVDISYTIATGVRTNSIAVIGLTGSSVTITVTSGGTTVYSVTSLLSTRKSTRWYEYFFGAFSYRKSVVFFNLPPYRNAQVTVTVHRASGSRGIGGIILGNAVYLGDTQYQPTSDHLNFSEVERDDFGNITLTPRRSVPKVREEVWFKKELTQSILNTREQLNGVPAIWSGVDDFQLDYFEPLFIYGIHKEFSINLADPNRGVLNLEVEEL